MTCKLFYTLEVEVLDNALNTGTGAILIAKETE